MGSEFSEPFKNCCCAAPAKINGGGSIGTDTYPGVVDGNHYDLSWIIMIQANWRGAFQRMRYYKRREERRRKSTHFLTQDQLETISKRRLIDLHILHDVNEAELNEQLETKEYRYRTTGATYSGQWLGGFRHGRGKMFFKDGASYEGTWYLGRAHGYGIFTHVAGETYEGEWADDQRHGKGATTHVNQFRYVG